MKLVYAEINNMGIEMELDNDRLLELYPGYTSVLGPYDRPDGWKHVVLNNANAPKGMKGKTKTISFPKALVEVKVGRRLLSNETIDHDDRDKTNNDLNNLIIRDRVTHSQLDATRVHVEQIPCVGCGTLLTPSAAQRNSQALNGGEEPAGPFCSRKCTGIYGAKIQNGGEKLERKEIVKTYFRSEK